MHVPSRSVGTAAATNASQMSGSGIGVSGSAGIFPSTVYGQAASDWLHTADPKLKAGDSPVSGAPDLLIFDVMMPYLDGLTLCRRLRAKGVLTPILMVTARTETLDRVSGLDAGADAYIAKPFEADELLANVRALIRRVAMHTEVSSALSVGDLRVDEAARRAWRSNRELELTRTEFDLLVMLARNAGMVVTHTSIYETVWQFDFGGSSRLTRQ